ncbi:MAG: nuclear transport factor 2 family protein [Solirubrobacteraceae bacterium]
MTDRFSGWISAYEAAWRTEGIGTLRELFTADAPYRAAPFDDPLVGLDAIAQFWEDEREGPDEIFTLNFEIVAAQGDTAVARVEVVYGAQPKRIYRDLWIITLTNDGRCSAFEEWPFHPGQARQARTAFETCRVARGP